MLKNGSRHAISSSLAFSIAWSLNLLIALMQILLSLSRKMHIDSTVDLRALAEETEGFSGADLQALFYNAHLESVHDAVNLESADKGTRTTAVSDVKFTTFEARGDSDRDD